jgi:murein DD-endopeptidase MepM/ murein hydrolase activator NlpD
MTGEKKRKRFVRRLMHKYRFVVMNDDTFEEKMSLRLTPLNLFTLVGSVTILLIVIVTSLIAFTPLREYIPGYADVNMRRQVISLALRADSLEMAMISKDAYMANINNVLSGKVVDTTGKTKPAAVQKQGNLNLEAGKNETELRKQVESQDPYSLAHDEVASRSSISSFFFFSPVKGMVTSPFSMTDEHYGVDIVAPENEAIKATLDGTVIFANWTTETGYVIQVQHSNNLISVYKHNSALMKKAGQYVKAGEVLAIIGNSGEHSTGPHLHFELWYNGAPVDPQDYMVFGEKLQ